MKKFIKWGGIVLLIPVSLFIILSILLYLPPIQNFVVSKITEVASESTGMDIKVQKVSLSFPLNLVVHETTVVSEQDTLLDVNRLKVKVQLWPLVKQKVEIDGLELTEAKVDTRDLIEGLSVKGQLERFRIESHGVDLKPEMAIINKLDIENTDLSIVLADTTAADTTASDTIPWKIKIEKVNLKQVSLALHMPLDSMSTRLSLGKALVRDGMIDLGQSSYFIDRFQVEDGEASYIAGNKSQPALGFDPSYIDVKDIHIGMDSVYYKGDDLHANISAFNLKERSGLEIIGTKGKLQANAQSISVPTLEIRTADSKIQMNAQAEWALSSINEDGQIKANFFADISKHDLFKFVPDLPETFQKDFPEAPMKVAMSVQGSLNALHLTNFDFEIPNHVSLTTEGTLNHVLDSLNRQAYVEMKADFPNMSFLRTYMGDAVIPMGTGIEGIAEMKHDSVSTTLALVTPHEGTITAEANYRMGTDAYAAKVNIDSLNLNAFLPKDSLYYLSAGLKAEGQGFDFFSPATHLNMEAAVKQLDYGKDSFSGLRLKADLKESKATAQLDMADHHLNVSSELEALLKEKDITAKLTTDIRRLDLQSLGLSETPFESAQDITIKFHTDGEVNHHLRADIRKNQFTLGEERFDTKDILLGVDLKSDSILSFANAGDLTFLFQSGNGLDSMLNCIDGVSSLIEKQWSSHAILQGEIRKHLPDAHLRILSGNDNPVSNFLSSSMGLEFKEFLMTVDLSPEHGARSSAELYQLHTDSLMLDTITFNIKQEPPHLLFDAHVKANRNKNQEGFNIGITGDGGIRDAKVLVEYLNEKNEQGAYIGFSAYLEDHGIRLSVLPEQPTFVYRPFTVNPGNFVYLDDSGKIEANLSMLDDKNTGLHLYSTPDSTSKNDVTLALNKIDIAEFKRVVPYMPDIAGLISAELHYVEPKESMAMSSIEASVDEFAYNHEDLGNWALSAVYLPKENQEHCIDGYILRNEEEIASISGSYFSDVAEKKSDWLEATLGLNHFPLGLTNAFVSRKLAELSGELNGEMSVQGSTAHPRMNGFVTFDDVNVFLPPVSMNLRFDNQPIKVSNSKLNFDKYKIYTLGKSPFVINGDVDFSTLNATMLDLQLVADDFELINGKKTKESLVYGKLYIDVATTIKGTPDKLKVRGAANILGKSDFTYILKDSPLTVEDRLNDMVTFVNFNDTTDVAKETDDQALTLGGIDVLMALHIDQAVQGRVDLNANGSNYMVVEGGGDLSFQYTPEGNMYMNGRYSLMSGEMKYEMPVIPLKTFKIQEGSFIEWTGNLMNPNLNIKAYEKVRSSVSTDGKTSRMVAFNVGVNLTNRLENLGFTFTLEAPEDGAIQDELAAMSPEEKNKLAVTMLVTGLYIAESNAASGLDANSALNSFLQSEINNIAGSALQSIDVNFGMEKNDLGEGGRSSTDYNFQFAKRFWNNRFRVVIGGKISTGSNTNQDDSFIDNISLEYRLDNSGTRYIKVFHDRKYANVLEGEIVETGGGIVLRKKVSRIGELFIFKKKKKKPEEENEKEAEDEKQVKAEAVEATKEEALTENENEKNESTDER